MIAATLSLDEIERLQAAAFDAAAETVQMRPRPVRASSLAWWRRGSVARAERAKASLAMASIWSLGLRGRFEL